MVVVSVYNLIDYTRKTKSVMLFITMVGQQNTANLKLLLPEFHIMNHGHIIT